MTRLAERRDLAERAVATKGVSIALACRAFGVDEALVKHLGQEVEIIRGQV